MRAQDTPKVVRRQAGFTIVELLVVVGILLILFNLLLVPLMTGMSLTGATQAEVEAQDRVNRALAQLQRDLSQAMYVYPQLSGAAADVLLRDPPGYPLDLLRAMAASRVDLVLPKRDERGNIIQPLVPDDYITRYYVAPLWDDVVPAYENFYRRSKTNPPDGWNLCVLYRVRFNPFDPQLDEGGNVTNPLFEGPLTGLPFPWRVGEIAQPGPYVDAAGNPIEVSIHWQLPWFYEDSDLSPVQVTGRDVPYSYWWTRLSDALTPGYKADVALYAQKMTEAVGDEAARRNTREIAMFGLDNYERGKFLPLGLFDTRVPADTPATPAYRPPAPGFSIEPALVTGETLAPSQDHSVYRASSGLWQPVIWIPQQDPPEPPPLEALPAHVYDANGVEVTQQRTYSQAYPGGHDGGTYLQPGVDYRNGTVSFAVQALNMYIYDWENKVNVGWGTESGEISEPPDPWDYWDDLVQLDENHFQVRGWYHEKNAPPNDLPPLPPELLGTDHPVFMALANSEGVWVKRVLRETATGKEEQQLFLYGRVAGTPGKKEYKFDPRTGLIAFAEDPASGPLAEDTIPSGCTLVRIEIQVRYKWRDNFTMPDVTKPAVVNDTVLADYATWTTATARLSVIAFGPAESRPGEIRRAMRVAVRNARL